VRVFDELFSVTRGDGEAVKAHALASVDQRELKRRRRGAAFLMNFQLETREVGVDVRSLLPSLLGQLRAARRRPLSRRILRSRKSDSSTRRSFEALARSRFWRCPSPASTRSPFGWPFPSLRRSWSARGVVRATLRWRAPILSKSNSHGSINDLNPAWSCFDAAAGSLRPRTANDAEFS